MQSIPSYPSPFVLPLPLRIPILRSAPAGALRFVQRLIAKTYNRPAALVLRSEAVGLNPLGVKAGLLGAAAFVLLVPTFNALNAAHFDAVEPPFQLDPPEPPDLDDPPPGDEDLEMEMEVPAGAAGGCKAFTLKENVVYERAFGATGGAVPLAAPGQAEGEDVAVDVPPGTAGLLVVAGFQEYRGGFRITVSDPEETVQDDHERTVSQTFDSNGQEPYQFEAREPLPGEWTIPWRATPIAGQGGLRISIFVPECKPPEGAAPPEADA